MPQGIDFPNAKFEPLIGLFFLIMKNLDRKGQEWTGEPRHGQDRTGMEWKGEARQAKARKFNY